MAYDYDYDYDCLYDGTVLLALNMHAGQYETFQLPFEYQNNLGLEVSSKEILRLQMDVAQNELTKARPQQQSPSVSKDQKKY